MKFDGRGFADKIESQLMQKMSLLQTKPKIVSILVGDDPASALYTRLKKQAAERVGVLFEIVKLEITNHQSSNIKQKVQEIGAREDVTGVMVQLPLPGVSRKDTDEILAAIPLDKDVDGLRYPESRIVPPVVKAILSILDEIAVPREKKYVVVGAGGFVGNAVCLELQKRGIGPIKVESDTDNPTRRVLEGEVVISCVGKEGVVQGDMVRDGAIVIDVGAPKGDMTAEVYQRASVSVEVPGGVGPVTIACLLMNALDLF